MSSYILLRVCWAQKPAGDLFLFFQLLWKAAYVRAEKCYPACLTSSTSNMERGVERLSLCPESYVKPVWARHDSTRVGAPSLLCVPR